MIRQAHDLDQRTTARARSQGADYVTVRGRWVHLPEDATPRTAPGHCAGCCRPAREQHWIRWRSAWAGHETAIRPFAASLCPRCARLQGRKKRPTPWVVLPLFVVSGSLHTVLAVQSSEVAHWVAAGMMAVGVALPFAWNYWWNLPLFAVHAPHRSEIAILFRDARAAQPFARANGWDPGDD